MVFFPSTNLLYQIVGNKVDIPERAVFPKQILFHRKVATVCYLSKFHQRNLQYYDMSVKMHYQITKPFLFLARVLLQFSFQIGVC